MKSHRAIASQRRAERQRDRTRSRTNRRALAAQRREAAEDRAMFKRFEAAYVRWNAHRGGELHDTCPACSATVIIEPRVLPGQEMGEFDASHAQPVCTPWLLIMQGMGGSNLRETSRPARGGHS